MSPKRELRACVARARSGCAVAFRSLRFGLTFVLVAPAFAEDTVLLRVPETGGRIELRGEVAAFDHDRLELTLANDTVRTADAADVVRVETPRLPSHLAGLAAWADRDVPPARRKLAIALGREPRAWVRRQILAALIPADLAAADRPAAVSHFLALYRSDPHPAALADMPAVWGDRPVTAATRAAANRWKTGDDAERFVAGSVLVSDPATREAGVAMLRRISVTGERTLAELAKLARWRAKALAGATTAAETDAARRRVRELPEELRAGPSFTLGLALEAAGRDDGAVEAYLWTGLLDDADPPRAADALLRAAKLLRRRGDAAGATRLLREVRARLPFGPAADEAAEELADLIGGPAVGAAAGGGNRRSRRRAGPLNCAGSPLASVRLSPPCRSPRSPRRSPRGRPPGR